MNKKKSAHMAALYGMLIALAFVLSFVESLIPISLGIPGVKLGLANLVTVVGLYTVGTTGTIVVSLLRIVLTGFTFGNLFAMLYSLAGWGLSIVIMILCKKKKWFGTSGISILGGIGHNIGQITVAAFVVKQAGVFFYLPMLLIAGTAAGLVIGILGSMIITRIRIVIKKLY
ncbi:heptaprenyl diphosphate synthase [Lacrimispora xylanisolvens]|jgi:heptaprenyl diphosphate synthase|uniref:Heptaprenyl diphosphate synthase n=1 Tax=Lacrimispora xylanisolvens TaxID=384636 RepID=A0A2S6HRE9_9FIRM|nr:Gx transporter family protein [Hungatella xylanolytica]MBE5988430.1 Gx transporter family protein [Paenibacillaceae bacterium]PPK80212.1 heptaprenyl diphosphate synthase [Hungatella xylanolytica]